jgi:flagellar basal-body rod protein FlgF
MNTLDIAAVGLRQDLDRLKLISHNIANLSTSGYKRQIAVQKPFADLMEVGADLQVQTDGRAGKLNATGQALDIALPEGRYLLLELDDGSQALSRQGALQLDAQGLLRTVGGHKVIGSRGPVGLRSDQRSGLEVDAQGELKSQGQTLDALRLISTKPGLTPRALGDGLYAADIIQWDVDTPTVGVRSGHLEQSNVVPSQEMVSLMNTTRHAETMVRVFQAADDMQATAIRRLGENN